MTYSSLVLSDGALREVRDQLKGRIRAGLQASGGEIKALPSFSGAPKPSIAGQALVIDTGGTNMRAAVIELDGKGHSRMTHGPLKKRLPRSDATVVTREQFFDAQAELARAIDAPKGLPVGYCFSYPTESGPDRDSRLIRWTKGIDVPGVEGTKVGAALGEALGRCGLASRGVRVLNDTVASLLGGAYAHDSGSGRTIGLIVGTGTNMSAFFDRSMSPKVPETWAGPMAFNLESGNFDLPHRSSWDEELDHETTNPGQQRFEKAVSGMFLPQLFARIAPDCPGFDPNEGAGALVRLRTQGDKFGELANLLLTRSADLTAASLVAVADLYGGSEPVGVLAEGSLFWNDPEYAPRVQQTMTRLAMTPPIRILRLEEANLIGAACVALDTPFA